MNCISESLFGYEESYQNCFDFKSYIRYFSLSLRMYKLLFPKWTIHLSLDKNTYESYLKPLFDYHHQSGLIDFTILDKAELCKMMLYRMTPIFMQEHEGIQKYDRVLCRDIDSLPTYRERQAVEYWIKTGRISHAITDSFSHNIPLMGGMIGFQTNEFRKAMETRSFDKFLLLDSSIDFNKKGSDQTFLNKVVLPKVAKSMVEHYILGLPQSFRGECFNFIQDDPVEDIAPELRESNILVNHIGQAGFIIEPVMKFLEKYETNSEYYTQIEKQFPEIFYWHL